MFYALKHHFARLAALSFFLAPCYADVYECRDSSGVKELTNLPYDARYQHMRCIMVYRSPARDVAALPSSQVPIGPILNGIGQLPKSAKPFGINEKNRRQFAPHIDQIAGQHRLDPALLYAVISAESGFNPRAVSPKGAQGLMQLMPDTARRFGVTDPFDPVANVRAGARYLRWLLDQFDNNTRLALAAYNAGENTVIRYGKRIPPYQETQTYVVRVLSFYSHFRGQSRVHAVLQPATVAQSSSGGLDPVDGRR